MMLSWFKNWIYNRIVASQIVYHFRTNLGWWYYRYVLTWCPGDHHVTDDSGKTMKTIQFNGKNVTPFTHHRYSTIKDMNIRSADVLLCGYPETGGYWAFEILYMLMHGKAETSKGGKLLESTIEFLPDVFLESAPSPRILSSHLLYDELPKKIIEHKTKIVLTIRCPKDTAVSLYHHNINFFELYHYNGTFDDHFKMFMKGELDFGSYFNTYHSWGKVTNEQQDNQIFVLEFEELRENPVQKIMELANFLDLLTTEEFAEKVAAASQFYNPQIQCHETCPIFRKGEFGDWRNVLTNEQTVEVDRAWRDSMSDFE